MTRQRPRPGTDGGGLARRPLPRPSIAALATPLAQGLNSTFTCGKGGNVGSKYMYAKGLELLRSQGFAGGLENIAMVGDVLATDIKGGNMFGVKTFLVLSGCGTVAQEPFFPEAGKPTCVFGGVGDIAAASAALGG